jgi:hypothetical protein
MNAYFPIIRIFISSLIPLAGVLFFGWNVMNLVVIYWLENIVIGIFNYFRIKRISDFKQSDHPKLKYLLTNKDVPGNPTMWEKTNYSSKHQEYIAHYIWPYALFTFNMGFVLIFGCLYLVFELRLNSVLGVLIFLFVILLTDLVSYLVEYYNQSGKFKKTEVIPKLEGAFGRMAILHMGVFVGTLIMIGVYNSVYIVILMALLKIVVELNVELRRAKFDNL